MRKVMRAYLAAVAGLLAATGTAYAGCTDATIRGDYAFTVHGNGLASDGITSIGRFDGVGVISFDGKGNLVQEDFVLGNGAKLPGATFNPSGFATNETGTYSVNPDCTGTAVIDLAPGNQLTLAVVISKAARTIHTVVSERLIGGNAVLVQVYSDFEKIEGRD